MSAQSSMRSARRRNHCVHVINTLTNTVPNMLQTVSLPFGDGVSAYVFTLRKRSVQSCKKIPSYRIWM